MYKNNTFIMFEKPPTTSTDAPENAKASGMTRRTFMKRVAGGAVLAAATMSGCSAQEQPDSESSQEAIAQAEQLSRDLLAPYHKDDLTQTTTYKYLAHRFSPEALQENMRQYHKSADEILHAWKRAIAHGKERWLSSARNEQYMRDLAEKNNIDITEGFDAQSINGTITINGEAVAPDPHLRALHHDSGYVQGRAEEDSPVLESPDIDTTVY